MSILHITLATTDVARSAAFYQQAFGWQPIPGPANADRAVAWLAIHDDQQLHLVESPDFQPSPYEHEFGRHIAIGWPAEKLSALKTTLQSLGAVLVPPQRPTPFERFFFRDPNGYIFEVVAQATELPSS